MCRRIHNITTTCMLHSAQGLQLCSSRLHNARRYLWISSADSHMPHSQLCLALRFFHWLQYSLCIGYIASRCICFAIIVFYMSVTYCPFFALSSTMRSVLHILRWSIIGLQCFFLLICIIAILALMPVDISGSQVKPTMPSVLDILRWSMIGMRCFFLLIHISIIAILALIPVDISGSQVKPLEFSSGPSSLAGSGNGIAFVTFIFEIPASPSYPQMLFVIRAVVVNWDVWVTASDLRFRKCYFGGQIVKKNSIVNTRCMHADHHSRCRVLRLLDLTLDCGKNVVRHPLLVAVR